AIARERRRFGWAPAACSAMTDENAPAREVRRAAHEIEIARERIERGMRLELRARDSLRLPRLDEKRRRRTRRAGRRAQHPQRDRQLFHRIPPCQLLLSLASYASMELIA